MKNYHLQMASLFRVWSLVSGLLLAYAVTTHLTLKEQGLYYLFQSQIAAQFFFDLGIGFVLSNYAGKKIKELKINKNTKISTLTAEKIKSICIFSMKWTSTSAFLMMLVLSYVGTIAINKTSMSNALVFWYIYVFFSSINIVLNGFLSILEGIGEVLTVSSIRFYQSVINITLFFIGTYYTHQATIIFATYGLSLIISCLALGISYKRQILQIVMLKTKYKIEWKKEIFPFQWRIAISWISGYFIFQYLTYLIAYQSGLSEAGRYGLTMQILQSVNFMASIILTFKISAWTKLSFESRTVELLLDYIKITLITTSLVLFSNCVIYILLFKINFLPAYYMHRFVAKKDFVLLLFSAVFNQIFFCTNYYFRSQLKDPLWVISLFVAIALLSFTNYAVINLSAKIAAQIYFSLCAALCIGALIVVYIKSVLIMNMAAKV